MVSLSKNLICRGDANALSLLGGLGFALLRWQKPISVRPFLLIPKAAGPLWLLPERGLRAAALRSA